MYDLAEIFLHERHRHGFNEMERLTSVNVTHFPAYNSVYQGTYVEVADTRSVNKAQDLT